MHFILALSWTLCAFVAFASASDYICCTPDQFDMGWRGPTGYVTKTGNTTVSGVIENIGHMFYDATNQKQTVTTDAYLESSKITSTLEVRLYQGGKGKKYSVDLITDTCKITPLEEPFAKFCVPKDAKLLGEYTLGLKPNVMKVRSYGYAVEKLSFTSTVTYITKDECVPISDVLKGQTPTTNYVTFQGFVDFEVGLKNASVFDIPKQCKKEIKMPSVGQTFLGDLLKLNK